MGSITKLLESGQEFTNSKKFAAVEGGGVYKGYEYLVTLTSMGIRCGYVAISKKHPLYAKEMGAVEELEVHGGVTFYDTHNDRFKLQ